MPVQTSPCAARRDNSRSNNSSSPTICCSRNMARATRALIKPRQLRGSASRWKTSSIIKPTWTNSLPSPDNSRGCASCFKRRTHLRPTRRRSITRSRKASKSWACAWILRRTKATHARNIFSATKISSLHFRRLIAGKSVTKSTAAGRLLQSARQEDLPHAVLATQHVRHHVRDVQLDQRQSPRVRAL